MKKFAFTFLCFHLLLHCFSQEDVVDHLVDHYRYLPIEKVYLQTSREVLTLGDTLYFSAFVLEGKDHTPSGLSGLLHVELIGPTGKMQEARLKINYLGRSHGDFALSDSLPSGMYTLRAFTNYQLNDDPDFLYKKSIKVLPRSNSEITENRPEKPPAVRLAFFPEGGEAINGDYNFVAFKATNEFGHPLEVKGTVVDSYGDAVVPFESKHDGMGVLHMKFEEDQRYFAIYEHRGVTFTQSLPVALPAGYLMHVRHSPSRVNVVVKAQNISMDSTFMIVQCRGNPIYVLQALPELGYLQYHMDRADLPSGIIQLTFFDANKKAVAERLIYNENPLEVTELQITTNQPTYGLRSPVDLSFDLQHAVGPLPALATLSTTVLPKNLFVTPQQTIASYLLFTSDLKGFIHNPTYYLEPQNDERLAHIDLLMMTHGWRKFDWEQVLRGEAPIIEFPVEKGISIEGRVTSHLNRKKGIESDIYLSFLEDPFVRLDTTSLEDGSFRFDGLEFQDTLTAYVKTLANNQKRREKGKVQGNTYVDILEWQSPPRDPDRFKPYEPSDQDQMQVERGQQLLDISMAFDGKTILLDELTIEDRRDKFHDPFESRNMLYSTPDDRIMLDSIPGGYNSIFDYLYGVAGVRVMGSWPNQTVQIRGVSSIMGSNEPLYLLDGFPVDQSMVNTIPVQNVLFIDVLRGAQAAIYGSRGGGGVIAIYSRRGGEILSTPANAPVGLTAFPLLGFTAPRVFYMPDYSSPTEQEKVRPDFRSTIYWNPLLEVREGNATDSFFTSDEKGEFIIYSEGISIDGRTYIGSTTYRVE